MEKKKTLIIIFTIILLSIFSWRYMAKPGYFSMHDDMQAMRVLELDKCLRDGQIPCRWVPDMGYGYGYPQFNYYPPLPYYVMEGFHLLGFSILDSVKIGFILSLLLSAVTMFFLGKSLWGNWGGLVSSVFYTYAPYRAMDVYNRGAMGELWSFVFFPLIFWAVFKLFKEEKRIYLVWLAVAAGGLLLTHNISSLIFFPFVFCWSLLLFFIYKKWSVVPKLFLAAVWGIGLASFFVLPMIFERKFAHTETLLMGYFNYLAHFVSWRQLFFSTHWGYGSSILGPNDDVSFSVGIFHWLFSLLVVIFAFWKREDKKTLLVTLFLFIGGILATFMTHLRSIFIWSSLPILAWLQFPWRFLVIAIFLFSTLVGGIFGFVQKKRELTFSILLISLVIFLNFGFFRPGKWYEISDKEKFSGELWEKQLTISIFDYLPIFAKMPPDKKAPEEPIFIEGKGEVTSYQKGTFWQKGEIEITKNATIRLPFFYFPGWEVYVNGQKIDFSYDNFLGLPTFGLPEGKYQIYARLNDTPLRKTSNIVSAISMLVLFSFPLWRLKLKNV